jgi:hypothetical protein
MSRKVLKQKYYKGAGEDEDEEAIAEKKMSKPDSSSQRASLARGMDSSAGAAALTSITRIIVTFLKRQRPGAVVVSGFDNEEGVEEGDRTIDEEQATLATREDSTLTVNVIAQVVDTEEENRRLREQDRLRRENDQLHNRLRHMVDDAAVVASVITTHRAEGKDHEFCTRGRQWCAGAILLVLVAVAITLALVLPLEPVPEPTTPEPTTPELMNPETTIPEQTTLKYPRLLVVHHRI